MAKSVANGSELVPRSWGTAGLSRLVDGAHGVQGIANWHKRQGSSEPRHAATTEVETEFSRAFGHVAQTYQKGRFVQDPVYRRQKVQT